MKTKNPKPHSNPRMLFLSFKPRHAKAILDGRKKVDLRRKRPKIQAGDLALIYATKPQCELVGAFEVAGVLEDTPTKLWPKVKNDCGMTMDEFFKYFAGAKGGVEIVVGKKWSFGSAMGLAGLHAMGIKPTQGYWYLKKEQVVALTS
jgi:predicted transcriptional regulator